MVTCTRCRAANMNINGWWFLGHERFCPTCSAIISSDDTDHGDEHVETEAESERLHVQGVRHQTRTCRVCIRRGIPLRPDVIFVGPDR